jgi:hypothetical protein
MHTYMDIENTTILEEMQTTMILPHRPWIGPAGENRLWVVKPRHSQVVKGGVEETGDHVHAAGLDLAARSWITRSVGAVEWW